MTRGGHQLPTPLWSLSGGIKLIQGFLHYLHTLFHHCLDLALFIMWQKVGNPYDPAYLAGPFKNLHGRVVVRRAGALGGPD